MMADGERDGIAGRRTARIEHCLRRPIDPPFNDNGTGSPS